MRSGGQGRQEAMPLLEGGCADCPVGRVAASRLRLPPARRNNWTAAVWRIPLPTVERRWAAPKCKWTCRMHGQHNAHT